MADVSVRESIQWKPDPPSEPTSTVVLTSPGKHFVDVRILLPLGRQRLLPFPFPEPCPARTNFPADPSGILTPDRLDWAFAGTSTSEVQQQEQARGPVVRTSEWTHWVDSRTTDPEPDRGEVSIAADGRAVEVGRMVNPATGMETEYVEVWVPGEVRGGEVVVLKTEAGGRGVVVRVGCWVQGVVRDADGVSVGRWERRGDGEGWRVAARMGEGLDEVLGWVTGEKMGGRRLEVGGKVEAGGRAWDVLELLGDVDGVLL